MSWRCSDSIWSYFLLVYHNKASSAICAKSKILARKMTRDSPATAYMRVRRVLVTGALGFTGRFLVHSLCKQGYHVRAADIRLPRQTTTKSDDPLDPEVYDSRAEWVVMDMRDERQVTAAVAGVDTIFHTAALVPFNLGFKPSTQQIMDVNVHGTVRLVQYAEQNGVRNFVLISSTGVVFEGKDIAFGDETMPIPWPASKQPIAADSGNDIRHNDIYSYSKALAEGIVLNASDVSGMACVSIRPNGIWGVGEYHHTPKALLTASAGFSAIAIAARAGTDWTHRDNLVHACNLALKQLTTSLQTREMVAGKAYFVTDGWVCHIMEFFSPILKGLGFVPPFPCLYVPRFTAFTADDGEKRVIAEDMRLSRADFNALERKISASAGRSTGGDEDEVVVTAAPLFSVPAWAAYIAAVICEFTTLLLRPCVNVEPFLTRPDVRKLSKHNYYSSKLAEKELGYRPIKSTAAGLREMTTYYQRQQVSGSVSPVPLSVWFAVVVGLSVTGLLAYDFFGMLSGCINMFTMLHGIIPTIADVYTRTRIPALANHVGDVLQLVCKAEIGASSTAIHVLQRLLQGIFWAAMLAHALQGMFAYVFALKHRLNALGWAVQTSILGFASTQRMLQLVEHPHVSWVPVVCVSGFMLCVPAALLAVELAHRCG